MSKDNSLERNVFYMLLAVLIVVSVVISSTAVVHAEEIVESETLTDSEQNERLNNLEIRLEELGYSVNEARDSINAINERFELLEQERLEIRDQLDLIIIGLDDLCTYSIEYLGNFDSAVTVSQTADTDTLSALNQIYDSSVELNENTVSGNAIVTAFGDNIKTDMQNISETSINEFNETLLKTNTLLSYLFVLILFLLVLMVAYGVGSIIQNIIKRNVL
ncbi:MAG: hypothetical protein MR998_10925 [Lachnospiraceae bacterium]|nr:hypothetical protein [Lachnospiraceae bacterium]